MALVIVMGLLLFHTNIQMIKINNDMLWLLFGQWLIFEINYHVFFFYRTRQRTSVELLLDIPSSLSSLDILRRICDQCALSDIEYFDPVFFDGVKIVQKKDNSLTTKWNNSGYQCQLGASFTQQTKRKKATTFTDSQQSTYCN